MHILAIPQILMILNISSCRLFFTAAIYCVFVYDCIVDTVALFIKSSKNGQFQTFNILSHNKAMKLILMILFVVLVMSSKC